MKPEDPNFTREQLEKAIAAQERLRGTLADDILETTLAALGAQLNQLNPEAVVKQQRKLVSILFMDIVSSTRLTRELDPEESLAIMDRVLQNLAEPVQTHGGKVTRYMGDGFLAVFGLPQSRENDPEMAVRAGLGILQTAQGIALDLDKEHQLKGFRVRIGVNTGLIVSGGVTEAEDTIMGSAINLAARLESAAPPGGLLISQYTYPHVRGIFDLSPAKSIPMKGFSTPIQVFQVRKAKPHAFRFKTRGIEGIETSMIGRDAELEILKDAFDLVSSQRESQAVTIVGEAGLGKSRLLDAFESWLNQQWTPLVILKNRATLGTLNLPYGFLRDLFAARFEILDNDPTPVVRVKIIEGFKKAHGTDKDVEMKAHYVGQLLGYDFRESPFLQDISASPQQFRDRALVYLVDFIKANMTEAPMAFFLDDLHWADDSSLDILQRLIEELAAQPVLFVALTRPALFERRTDWGAKKPHQQVNLLPLSHAQSESLLEQVLQNVQELPAHLSELIISNADGNPFYLEELVKMLIDDGVIIRGDPVWKVQSDRLQALRVPPTLTGIIQARLDRLPTGERTMLQQASVVGKVFWDATVSFMNQGIQSDGMPLGPGSDGTDKLLNTLLERGLIVRSESSAFSDAGEYFFKHAILQEVTYESVLKRTRRVYHAAVAEWLISHGRDRVGEIIGLIAGHLEKAGKNDQAWAYLCQAAEMAASNYAINEAVDFYTRALALTPEDDLEKRYTLMMGQEWVIGIQGDRDRQRKVLDSLAVLVDALADEHKKVEILLRKAWFAYWTSEFEEGVSVADEAMSLSEKIGDQNLTRQASYTLAWALFQQGDTERARERAQAALSMARQAEDLRAEGNTLNILGLIHLNQGDLFTAFEYLEDFLAIVQKMGAKDREITALNNVGVALTRLGNYPAAEGYFQQNLTIARETGDRSSESSALINLGWVTAAQEKWDLACAYSEAGTAQKRELEHLEAVAEGLVWLGHAWLGQNQLDKATAAYHESITIRGRLNQLHLAMGAKAGSARVALARDDLVEALDHVDAIVAFLAGGENLMGTWEPLRIYLTCYQVYQRAGNLQAEEILETAFNLLQEQASRISDPTYRKLFLENVSWHHDIICTWESGQT